MDRRREEGSNLVEMALVMFVLALLIIAVADLGRAFNHHIIITNAAREGARRASRVPDEQALIEAATRQEAYNSGIDLDGEHAKITVTGLGAKSGETITVTVEYTMTTILGGLVGFNEIPMRSETKMIVFGLDEANP